MSVEEARKAARETCKGTLSDVPWFDHARNEERHAADCIVDAFLAELSRSGMVVVPREPTRDMIVAGEVAVEDGIDETTDSYHTYKIIDNIKIANAVYAAMVSAALGSD